MANQSENAGRQAGERASGAGGNSYVMGDVGAGARVQQGQNLQWVEAAFADTPDGATLEVQFAALVQQLLAQKDLDEDTRALALDKTKAVAEGLAQAQDSPSGLRRALVDAKGFLSGSAGWAWNELCTILGSDAAQKTIGTIAEAGTKAAIQSLTGTG